MGPQWLWNINSNSYRMWFIECCHVQWSNDLEWPLKLDFRSWHYSMSNNSKWYQRDIVTMADCMKLYMIYWLVPQSTTHILREGHCSMLNISEIDSTTRWVCFVSMQVSEISYTHLFLPCYLWTAFRFNTSIS